MYRLICSTAFDPLLSFSFSGLSNLYLFLSLPHAHSGDSDCDLRLEEETVNRATGGRERGREEGGGGGVESEDFPHPREGKTILIAHRWSPPEADRHELSPQRSASDRPKAIGLLLPVCGSGIRVITDAKKRRRRRRGRKEREASRSSFLPPLAFPKGLLFLPCFLPSFCWRPPKRGRPHCTVLQKKRIQEEEQLPIPLLLAATGVLPFPSSPSLPPLPLLRFRSGRSSFAFTLCCPGRSRRRRKKRKEEKWGGQPLFRLSKKAVSLPPPPPFLLLHVPGAFGADRPTNFFFSLLSLPSLPSPPFPAAVAAKLPTFLIAAERRGT